MRIPLTLSALASILLALNTHAAAADPATKPTTQPDTKEGLVIEQEVTTEVSGQVRPPKKISFKIKGMQMRTDIGQMVSVIAFEDGRMATIMHINHSYILKTTSQTKEDTERAATVIGGTGKSPRPTPTGRHLKIRGFEAEEYTYDRTSVGGQILKVSLWIASDFPDAARIRAQQRAFHDSNKAMKMMATAMPGPDPRDLPNGVTIRTETDMPNGRRIVVDVLSTKFAPVEDSEFELPKGYQQAVVPAMPTGQ